MIDEHKAAAERDKTAKHLAGRAIMAMRAGFPIVSFTVHTGSAAESGIVCDWKQCRAEYSDDVTLIRRAFAFVYIGTILDQADASEIPQELLSEIKADQSQSQDIRETAAQWGGAASVMDTNPFAHVGYKLASQIARLDEALISELATELAQRSSLEEAW